MSPHTDLFGRSSVGYRESAARLEAVAARKRRKKDADIQRTRITIRGVRIVKSAAVGRPQNGVVLLVFVLFCFCFGFLLWRLVKSNAASGS